MFFFSEFLTCRQVLNIMVIFGFMLNYALRVNLTIAIVAMVVDHKPLNTTVPNGTVLALNDSLNTGTETAAALASSPNLATTTSAASLIALNNSLPSLVEKVRYGHSYFMVFLILYVCRKKKNTVHHNFS